MGGLTPPDETMMDRNRRMVANGWRSTERQTTFWNFPKLKWRASSQQKIRIMKNKNYFELPIDKSENVS